MSSKGLIVYAVQTLHKDTGNWAKHVELEAAETANHGHMEQFSTLPRQRDSFDLQRHLQSEYHDKGHLDIKEQQ